MRTSAPRPALGAVVALLAALVLTGAGAGPACACSCAAIPVEELVGQAPAVVVGTAVASEVDGSATRYTVEVDRSFTRRLPSTITVITASHGGACGVTLDLGEQRAIVLGWPGGGVTTAVGEWGASLCSNLRVTPADAELFAGPALDPIPGEVAVRNTSGAWTRSGWFVGGGIAAGMAVLAILIVAVTRASRRE